MYKIILLVALTFIPFLSYANNNFSISNLTSSTDRGGILSQNNWIEDYKLLSHELYSFEMIEKMSLSGIITSRTCAFDSTYTAAPEYNAINIKQNFKKTIKRFSTLVNLSDNLGVSFVFKNKPKFKKLSRFEKYKSTAIDSPDLGMNINIIRLSFSF